MYLFLVASFSIFLIFLRDSVPPWSYSLSFLLYSYSLRNAFVHQAGYQGLGRSRLGKVMAELAARRFSAWMAS